jgi:hypothetical protein
MFHLIMGCIKFERKSNIFIQSNHEKVGQFYFHPTMIVTKTIGRKGGRIISAVLL